MARMTNSLAIISVSAFLTLGVAFADPAADTNQDGKISKTEFINAANIRFIETDINGDNFITKEERKAHKEGKRAKRESGRFDRLDANNDGVITRNEFEAHSADRAQMREARRDINQDGNVDQFDKEARREKMREMRKQRGDRQTGDRRRMNPDADGDGFVSRAEHDAAVEKMFERLDVNGDGYLEKGEGKRRHKRRRFRR